MIYSQGKVEIVRRGDGARKPVGRFYESPFGRTRVLIDNERGITSEAFLIDRIAGGQNGVLHVTQKCWDAIPHSKVVGV